LIYLVTKVMFSVKDSTITVGELLMSKKDLFVKNQIEVQLDQVKIIKTSAGLLIYQ